MIKFKKGDILKCVHMIHSDCGLVIGEIYHCIGQGDPIYGEDAIFIQEKGGNWTAHQFELATKPEKVIKQYGIVNFMRTK